MHVPRWITNAEDKIYMLVLSYYARYLHNKVFGCWSGISFMGKIRSTKLENNRGDQSYQDMDEPWIITESLVILPWTAIHHQSNGMSVDGECVFDLLNDILSTTRNDKGGFICVDYRVNDDPMTYRIALNHETKYDCSNSRWPFGRGPAKDITPLDSDGDVMTSDSGTRAAVLSAVLSVNPDSLEPEQVDISEYFRALEGPCNNFGLMNNISLADLLLDCKIPNEKIKGSTIQLKTISGSVTMPVNSLINEAHKRLCVLN